MQIAISMWSLHKEFFTGKMNVVEFVNWAATTKATGVELLDVFWKDRETEVPAVLKALSETGLKVGAYAVGNDFVIADADKRKEQVQVILDGVDMAVKLGTKTVRVFAGDLSEGITFDNAREWIIEGLKEAAAYAEKHGVTLALENHGKLAGKSEQVIGVINDVGSPALRSTIDTGNFLLVDENPADAIRNLAKLAGHVHFKDFRPFKEGDSESYQALSGKKFVGTISGQGIVDLQAALRDLKAAGYDKWLSVEFEGLEDEKMGSIESAENLAQILATL